MFCTCGTWIILWYIYSINTLSKKDLYIKRLPINKKKKIKNWRKFEHMKCTGEITIWKQWSNPIVMCFIEIFWVTLSGGSTLEEEGAHYIVWPQNSKGGQQQILFCINDLNLGKSAHKKNTDWCGVFGRPTWSQYWLLRGKYYQEIK